MEGSRHAHFDPCAGQMGKEKASAVIPEVTLSFLSGVLCTITMNIILSKKEMERADEICTSQSTAWEEVRIWVL